MLRRPWRRGRKAFFFEKKKQKTFVRCRGRPISARLKTKSFLLLFFKKEDLSSLKEQP
jgi:hypothetical protein